MFTHSSSFFSIQVSNTFLIRQVDDSFPEYHSGEAELDLSVVYKAGSDGRGVDVGSGKSKFVCFREREKVVS